MTTHVSVVMAYFNNPMMLQRQYAQFMAYPEHVRRAVEYIVVDDCSDEGKQAVPPPAGWDIRFQLWRQEIKLRWNQDSCRNHGAFKASFRFLLLTDMDHLIPAETLADLTLGEWPDSKAFRFSRVNDQTFDTYKPHPNSWFMSRLLYDRVGGYDERLAGLYGTDGDFRSRLAKAATLEQLPQTLIRVGREHTPDASTPREYGRKTEQDGRRISELIAKRGKNPPRRGIFHVQLVYSTNGSLE